MDPFPLVLGLFAAVAAIASARAGRLALRARASLGWPAVEGRILRSEVVRTRTSGYGAGGASVCVPGIDYEYTVWGRAHHGTTITFTSPFYSSWPERAEAKCREYPVGSSVPVYYDPRKPRVACLERPRGSLVGGYLVALLLGAGAVALGGLLASRLV